MKYFNIITLLFMTIKMSFAITTGSIFSDENKAVKKIETIYFDSFDNVTNAQLAFLSYSKEIHSINDLNKKITPKELIDGINTVSNKNKELILENLPPTTFDTLRSLRLLMTKKYNHFCSGTFISDRILLTARHCIEKARYKGNFVENGEKEAGQWNYLMGLIYALDSDGNNIASSNIALFEEGNHDIAYILFPPNTAKEWASLPTPQKLRKIISRVYLSGWGSPVEASFYGFGARELGQEKGAQPIGSLEQQKGTSTRMYFDRRARLLMTTASLEERAPDTIENQCPLFGDSGGPLYIDGELVAVAAHIAFKPKVIMPLLRPEKPYITIGESVTLIGYNEEEEEEIWAFDNRFSCSFTVIFPPKAVAKLLP